jgi:hypothetical protein
MATTGSAPSVQQPPAPNITWSQDRPLTWADFKGEPPSDKMQESAKDRFAGAVGLATTSHEAAQTVTVLPGAASHYAYECASSSAGPVTCRITNFRIDTVRAEFDPNTSWVISSDANDALLRHEQGHFDVAAIYAARITARLRAEIVLATASASDSDQAAAQAKLEANIQGEIQDVQQQRLAAFSREQQQYDADTRHGTDAAIQQRWLDRISAELAASR